MKMKRIIHKIVVLAVLAVSLASCSSYTKLLKSGDNEAIYQAALQAFQEKRNERAIVLLGTVEHYYEGTHRDDTVKFFTAVSHFRRGDYYMSDELLQSFRRTFQNRTVFMEEAEYLIALGYLALSPPPELDQSTTLAAIGQFHEYLARYPNTTRSADISGYLVELQQKLYDKSFLNAKTYYDIGSYKSAIETFLVALDEYPETNRREEILYYIAKSAFLLADNSIENLQRGRYLEMIDHYYNLISEFPATKYRQEMSGMHDRVQRALQERYGEGSLNGESITPSAAPVTPPGAADRTTDN